ncbi:MAG TPA: hypothetical protein VJ600_02600 [Holophagaceae bacterium]|nr:hypothetical protein [Holophagaceae bacterium]
MSFLSLMMYFVLASVLVFQGLHLASEPTAPLGTLPEETALPAPKSFAWGAFLLTWGGLAILVGLLGFQWDFFVSMREAILVLDWIILAVFGAWVVFMARRIDYIGTPSADDHGHGHH